METNSIKNNLQQALILLQNGDVNTAIAQLKSIIELSPDCDRAYYFMALGLYSTGKEEEAATYIDKAIMLKPEQAYFKDACDIYFDAGLDFVEKKDNLNAIKFFKKYFDINPNDIEVLMNLGYCNYNEGNIAEAKNYFTKTIAIKPNNAEVYGMLGQICEDQENYIEASEMYLNALSIDPECVKAYINLSKIYFWQYKYNEAEECLNKALKLEPDNILALHCMGFLSQNMDNDDKAIKFYNRILEMDPDNAGTRFNLSCIDLLKGDYAKGWKDYEYRFQMQNKTITRLPEFNKPRWYGEDLKDKTLLVYCEQGLGDAIQISRFFPILNSMAKKVIVQVKSSLIKLFLDSQFDVEIIEENIPNTAVEFDYYVPSMSIMEILNIRINNIPCSCGYLKPDLALVQDFNSKFFDNNLYKIGIFWQGNKIGPFNRAMPLEKLLPLTRLNGVQVYSLQKGFGTEQLEELSKNHDIIDLGKHFTNFADTAAAIENLDIVITIDSAVVHLAGSLGKKAILMLPYHPDWRWMREITYTPWYDSAEIVRQPAPGDWDDTIKQVINKIRSFIYD